jgi:hypothetical protein
MRAFWREPSSAYRYCENKLQQQSLCTLALFRGALAHKSAFRHVALHLSKDVVARTAESSEVIGWDWVPRRLQPVSFLSVYHISALASLCALPQSLNHTKDHRERDRVTPTYTHHEMPLSSM